MSLFDNYLIYRDEDVDGVKGWWWPKSDHGAWDGPSKDWYGLKKAFDFVGREKGGKPPKEKKKKPATDAIEEKKE